MATCSPLEKVEVPVPFTSMMPDVVALPTTVKSPICVDEEFDILPPSSVRSPLKTPVDEAEKASCTFRLPAIVVEPVDISAPSKMARPEKADVLDAENAPLMFKLLTNVDDADDISPPPDLILNSVVLVESTKRRKSPVWFSVDEASINIPSVEVAKILKRAFWLIATAFVVVPM